MAVKIDHKPNMAQEQTHLQNSDTLISISIDIQNPSKGLMRCHWEISVNH